MPGIVLANAQTLSQQQSHGPIRQNWASPQSSGLVFWTPLAPAWGGTLNLGLPSSVGLRGTQQNGFVASTIFKGASQFGLVGPNFDGTDDRLDFGSGPDLSAGPLTMSAWICTTDNAANRYAVSLQNTTPLTTTFVGLQATGVIQAFRTYSGGGGTNKSALSSGSVISNNVWYHLAFTDPNTSVNGTELTLYRNGIKVTSSSTTNGTAPARTTDGTWVVSGRTTDNVRNWKGALADVRIYNRALTANEMFDLWRPSTRWDLYWQPSRRVYVFQSTTTRHQWMPLLGVN